MLRPRLLDQPIRLSHRRIFPGSWENRSAVVPLDEMIDAFPGSYMKYNNLSLFGANFFKKG